MMNYNIGRKVPVAVVFTLRLLDRIDEQAAKESSGKGCEPNRSEVIRRLVSEGLDKIDREAGEGGA
jgi:Arc/MetJ-type ribon-helix-helix transcriptional regulator